MPDVERLVERVFGPDPSEEEIEELMDLVAQAKAEETERHHLPPWDPDPQGVCDALASELSIVSSRKCAWWIVYILEALDTYERAADDAYLLMLERIRDDIEIRLKKGTW